MKRFWGQLLGYAIVWFCVAIPVLVIFVLAAIMTGCKGSIHSLATHAARSTLQEPDTNLWFQTPYGYLEELPHALFYLDSAGNLTYVPSIIHDASLENMILYHSFDLKNWEMINVGAFNVTWGTNIIPYHVAFTHPVEFFRLVDY